MDRLSRASITRCKGLSPTMHESVKTKKINNLNFHSSEVVSRYRDPQLQVGHNNSYLFNMRAKMCKFDDQTGFVPDNCDLYDQ